MHINAYLTCCCIFYSAAVGDSGDSQDTTHIWEPLSGCFWNFFANSFASWCRGLAATFCSKKFQPRLITFAQVMHGIACCRRPLFAAGGRYSLQEADRLKWGFVQEADEIICKLLRFLPFFTRLLYLFRNMTDGTYNNVLCILFLCIVVYQYIFNVYTPIYRRLTIPCIHYFKGLF